MWLAFKCGCGLTLPFLHKIYQVKDTNTFKDLALQLTDVRENEKIRKTEINSSYGFAKNSFKMGISLETPNCNLRVCKLLLVDFM